MASRNNTSWRRIHHLARCLWISPVNMPVTQSVWQQSAPQLPPQGCFIQAFVEAGQRSVPSNTKSLLLKTFSPNKSPRFYLIKPGVPFSTGVALLISQRRTQKSKFVERSRALIQDYVARFCCGTSLESTTVKSCDATHFRLQRKLFKM